MFILTSVILIILTYFVHECIGHAAAMKASGIRVTKLIFGLRLGPSLTLPLRGKWSGTDLVLYALPFGALTVCDYMEIQKLPFWERSRICASGPIASIIFGYFLFIASGFVVMVEQGMTRYPNTGLLFFSIAIIAMLLSMLRFGGRKIFTYLIPLVPAVLLIYLGYSLFGHTTSVVTAVELVRTATKVSEFSGALFFVGGFSINWFGITMLLPFRILGLPLDGEQIISPIMEKYLPRVFAGFESIGALLVGFAILYALKTELGPILLPFIASLTR